MIVAGCHRSIDAVAVGMISALSRYGTWPSVIGLVWRLLEAGVGTDRLAGLEGGGGE